MKYFIFIILIFTSSCCLAISQKLVDGANKYNIAVENLGKIESDIKTAYRSLEYWSKILDKDKNDQYASYGIKKLEQGHIDESNKQIRDLTVQYNVTKEIVKKLEPIKKKYDKQKEREKERENRRSELLNTIGTLGIPFVMFVLILWFFARHGKKYQQLLKDGKINKEEYDRMMQCNKSSMSDDEDGINPATGLPMTGVGISDVGGNIRGSSSDYSSSSSSDNNRSSWDRWY